MSNSAVVIMHRSEGSRVFNIGFYKGQPTDYVIQYVGGKRAAHGPGLTFYYLKHRTAVAVVPTGSTDADFVFHEVSSNYQEVTIQGQFTYRVVEPLKASELLNFGIDLGRRAYVSEDPFRLARRITNLIQMAARAEVQQRTLEDALREGQTLAGLVLTRVRGGEELGTLGVELLSLHLESLSPTPEVARALEAEAREQLLRQADEAISARRASAVEDERKIKENELASQISLEQRRQDLIDLEGANALRQAELQGKANEVAAQYRLKTMEAEWALFGGLDPRVIAALSLKSMSENAQRIGNFNITTEVLSSLLSGTDPGPRKT